MRSRSPLRAAQDGMPGTLVERPALDPEKAAKRLAVLRARQDAARERAQLRDAERRRVAIETAQDRAERHEDAADPVTIGSAGSRLSVVREPKLRSNRQRRRAAQRRTSPRTGPTEGTRNAVNLRDQDGNGHVRCVMCGGLADNQHHRENRGSGGRKGAEAIRVNSVAYLLSLCGSGTTGCHGKVTTPSAFGLTLHQVMAWGYVLSVNAVNVDAARVPVKTHRGWEMFLHDGSRVLLCGPDANPMAFAGEGP